MNNNEIYFEKLADYSKKVLDSLPIEKEVQALDYAVNKLYGVLKNIGAAESAKIKDLWDCETLPETPNVPVGLNTLGLLIDRFTILIIKEWCLRNKNNNPAKADELYRTQTQEIIHALAACRKGAASLNSKITNIKTSVTADSWEEAYFGMLAINLVLWESQEVLYIKDISKLPTEELRDYIHWFAYGNMQRNVLIELCEKKYWEKRDEK
ncbi:MAG: hypothetical protein LBV75_02265 [Paludibacter sp.]|jgi:hypothetical protein|nr:hypothetical protein [Paludibacter sp.]